MEEQAELQGWELLPHVDPLSPSAGDDDGGDPFGLLKADYFVLDAIGGLREEGGGREEKALSGLDGENQGLVDSNLVPDQLITDGKMDSLTGDVDLEEEEEESKDLSWLDSWGDEIEGASGDGKQEEVKGGLDSPLKSAGGEDSICGDGGRVDLSGGVGEGRGIVWWKVPLEVVKYCVFRMRPVWSVSIAAAMVGLLILSRRLYRMRRASLRIPATVAIADKKSPQIPTATNLNEAFMVLQRMPSIKASLPTTGVAPWPTIAFR